MVLIVLSSVKLAADTYFIESEEDSNYYKVARGLDYFFTIIFTIESLIKSITLGIVLDKGSYLREGWNILDFIIVLASIADVSISTLDF